MKKHRALPFTWIVIPFIVACGRTVTPLSPVPILPAQVDRSGSSPGTQRADRTKETQDDGKTTTPVLLGWSGQGGGAPVQQPAPQNPIGGTVVQITALPVGLLSVFQGELGKIVTNRSIPCVKTRDAEWAEVDTANFHPLFAAQGGTELYHEMDGNHLELRFEGEVTVGPRRGMSLKGEVATDREVVRRFEIHYLGSTGHVALANTYFHIEEFFDVEPGTPIRVRVAYTAMTADDGACASAVDGAVSLKPIRVTARDSRILASPKPSP